MPVKNLWGEIPVESTIKTPVTILREQATILSDKTSKLLLGEVKQLPFPEDIFAYELRVVAPALSNYSYSILSIYHDIKLYPLELMSSGRSINCHDEDAFYSALEMELSSERVHKVIVSLLSQSKAA